MAPPGFRPWRGIALASLLLAGCAASPPLPPPPPPPPPAAPAPPGSAPAEVRLSTSDFVAYRKARLEAFRTAFADDPANNASWRKHADEVAAIANLSRDEVMALWAKVGRADAFETQYEGIGLNLNLTADDIAQIGRVADSIENMYWLVKHLERHPHSQRRPPDVLEVPRAMASSASSASSAPAQLIPAGSSPGGAPAGTEVAASPPPAPARAASLEVANEGPEAVTFELTMGGQKAGPFAAPPGKTTTFAVPAGVGEWRATGENIVESGGEIGLGPGSSVKVGCAMVSRIMTGCQLSVPASPEGEVVGFLMILNEALKKPTSRGLAFVLKLPLQVTRAGESREVLALGTGEQAVRQAELLRVDPYFLTAAAMKPGQVGSGEAACGQNDGALGPTIDWSKGAKAISRSGDRATVTVLAGACGQFQHKVVLGLAREKSSWKLVSHARKF